MAKIISFVLSVTCLLTSSYAASRRLCDPCPSSEYPVCATNGTHWFLFRNGCRLDEENNRRGQSGIILLQRTEMANCFQKCDQVCTKEYAPICAQWGSNIYTFLNRCELDLENCQVGNIWTILHEGECPSTQPPTTTAQPYPVTTTSPATTLSTTARPPPPRPPTTQSPAPLPTTTPTSLDGCPSYCTMEYAPVCGTTGDKDRTFSNMCLFQVEACTSRQNWQIKALGICMQCDEACPKIYSPLCATFNGSSKSFDNECLLDLENCKTGSQWEIVHKGECPQLPANCPSVCPEIYQPVCAANANGESRTFPNVCYLNREVCLTNQQWNLVNSGECPGLTTTPAPSTPPFTVCPAEYQPVCAAYNGVQQTFTNRCVMIAHMCKTGIAWQFVSEGPCSPPTPETTSPAPTPETTLPTPTTTSPTPPTSPSPCPTTCPALYNPVCASYMGNIMTFSNGCVLSLLCCKTGQNWKVLFNGRCEDHPDLQSGGTSVCPAIYDPICAAFQGQTKTFANKCQMDSEISTTGTPWQIVATSECEKLPPEAQPSGPCPKCSTYYQPVCGFQQGVQKTFINECHMLAENCYENKKWVVVYDGECRVSDQPRNCPNICPLTYDPVCAVYNGIKRTFQNECELNHESYKTGAEWVIVSSGECDYCQPCSDPVDPICAEFSGQTQTFNNSCLMDYENCKTGSRWRVIYKTACTVQICPGFCPNVYQPVCATNSTNASRTFNSECEMRMESCHSGTEWTMQSEGACPSGNENCPSVCKVDIKPLCATNQKESQSFINECFLRSRNCGSDSGTWVLTHWGECTDDEMRQLNTASSPDQQSQPSEQPSQPGSGSQSSAPNQPSSPDQPSSPGQGSSQNQPDLPNQPSQSSQLSSPSHSSQPSSPSQSSQPSQANAPSNPTKQAPIQISGSLQTSQVIEISPSDAQIINQLINRLPNDFVVSYGGLAAAQLQKPGSGQQISSQKSAMPNRCRIVPCVATYNPVCGTFNGAKRTFSNPCSLGNFNCRYSEDWQILYGGYCEKSSEA